MRPQASPELEFTIREWMAANNRVAELEEQLSQAKAYRQYVGENEMMESATQNAEDVRETGVRLSDDSEWTFEQRYHCSVDPLQRDAAFAFIEDATGGQALRHTLTLSFGKGTYARAQLVKGMIAELFPQYEISLRVGEAPQKIVAAVTELLDSVGLDETVKVEEGADLAGATMRSWVVKQLKLGNPIPDAFQVFAPLAAVMVPPKPVMLEQPDEVAYAEA